MPEIDDLFGPDRDLPRVKLKSWLSGALQHATESFFFKVDLLFCRKSGRQQLSESPSTLRLPAVTGFGQISVQKVDPNTEHSVECGQLGAIKPGRLIWKAPANLDVISLRVKVKVATC